MPMPLLKVAAVATALAVISLPGFAAESRFHAGPLIPEFGEIASVDTDLAIPPDTVFKVVFDIAEGAEPGQISRRLETAARFLNMHVEAGVAPEDLHVALVIHGSATLDLLRPPAYREKTGHDNVNAALIAALLKQGVDIYLCGQSAAGHDIEKQQLLPGVQLALSAMTANALLQQQGYTLNPF